MDKIKINLLPPEIKNQAKKAAKQSLINKISIALLGVLILITSCILALVISQGVSVKELTTNIENEKASIQNKKEVEAVVILLKNRIDTINQFTTKKYKQRDVFNLITTLFPQEINLGSLLINKTTKVSIQGQTSDTLSLQKLFSNLTDPKFNEGKITSVTVESLSRNQAGKISFELSVYLAAGVL